MYLTRLELDTRRRKTMKALVSPNLFHGAIEAAFPGERTRKLWRIDKLGQHCYLLLLSDRKPMLDHAVEQFGFFEEGKSWETKEYQNLLDRVKKDTVWRFRLVANPTKSVSNGNGTRGSVHAHKTPFYQKKWLLERCEKNGFLVKEEEFTVLESKWQRFYKGAERKGAVELLAVTYEGILKVTEEEKFRKMLLEGMGRGKAFGMGLFTVAKVGDGMG
ncbi:MAG: type I-E CRISPR-associated protein Cas6/Cse3/CasE [Eubacteriales bacterium]|nr:type I-E CRISPR-associated protein Cas6/Cse3/CasE [Eubacteriales bacterium]